MPAATFFIRVRREEDAHLARIRSLEDDLAVLMADLLRWVGLFIDL